jgi:hypothetical protein
MRKTLSLALWIGLVAANLPAGTVSYDFSTLPYAAPQDAPAGSSMLQVTYLLSNFTFEANQELDIEFDPTLYSTMSNGQAPSGFAVTLFQPDNPPGAPGDFSALALTNGPSVSGSFSVDVVYFGSGQPGPQSYTVNQFDNQGNFVATVDSGYTGLADNTAGVPEPGSFWLGGMGLMIGAAWWVIRRRSRSTVQ